MSEESQSKTPRVTPLAESPLFWIVIFGGMAVLGMAVIGPKYARRHEGLVQKYEARSQAHGGAASTSTARPRGEGDQTPAREATDRSGGDVLPIAIFVGAVVLVAAFGAILIHRRKQRTQAANL